MTHHNYFKSIFVACSLVLFAASGYAQSVTITQDWNSGWACGCQPIDGGICGGDYWCINNPGVCGTSAASDAQAFADPVPGGNIVTQTTITYYGSSCGAANVSSLINGVAAGTPGASGSCACGDCVSTSSSSVNYACGFPGYNYGGSNTFTVAPDGTFCFDRVDITLFYAASGSTVPPTPSTPSGLTSVCPGTNPVYSISAGTDSYTWSLPVGWTFTGQNSTSITATAVGSSGNICVYASNSCGSSGSSCLAVTVLSNSSAAGSISSSLGTTICSGNSTTLSVVGGSLGTGASWQWYSGGCPGVPEGSGTSIFVTPGATTSYYVRAEGTCNNTSCVTTTITVNTPSTNPASAGAAPATICNGNATVLTVSGGSLGTGASWVWYDGSCGGVVAGSGSPLILSPAVTTTYYVRAESSCNTTTCVQVTVTVNSNSSAAGASISATSNPICVGSSTTLTVNPGFLGTGAVWQWYSGGCGGTPEGTGTSIVVTPGATTAYYVRAEGTCNTTTCATVTITVNTYSTDPVSITATSNPVCSGNSTTLSVNGGALGSGASWQWYSSSCGGTFEGTGSSLSVSPASTTTYYVRAEGSCNTTACVSVIVTVNSFSTAATSASASPNPICNGNSTTLSIVNGSLGTNAAWQWYSGGCGGVLEGNGTSLLISPSVTTTYYVRAEGICNTTSCVSVTVTVNTASTDPVSISATTNPLCTGNSTTLSVNGGSLGTGGAWQWYTVSCGGTFESTGSSIVVSPIITTDYYVRAEGTCNTTICVNLVITVIPSPTANAGNGGTECDLDFILNAVPSLGTGTWAQSAGTGTSIFIPDTNDPGATVLVDAYGSYTLTWTENNSGCTSSDNIILTFYQQPSSNAGNDQTVCGTLSTNLSAIVSIGTGTWTQLGGAGTSIFSDPNAPNSTVTVSTYGTYGYSWTEFNGGCIATDTVIIYFYEQPVADAGTGSDQCDLDFTFNATPSVGVGTWTQFIGTGTSSFSPNANDPNATVNVTQYGTYLFRWTEVNGGCSDYDDVTFNFIEQPVADAGPDETICGLIYTMQAQYTVGNGAWSFLGGSGTANFSNINSVNSTVTVSATGLYAFEWFISNIGCQDRDTVILNFSVSSPPTADAGPDSSACDLDHVLNAVPSIGTGTWSQVFGTGTSAFATVNDSNATVTVTNYGMYVFRWTEAVGGCSDYDDVTVNFFELPLADAGADDSVCNSTYQLAAVPAMGGGTWSQFTGPGVSFFNNVNSPLAIVTVSLMGTYEFVWTVNNNGCTSSDTVTILFTSPPNTDAGAGGNECGLNHVLSAIPSVGTGTWTLASGPGSTTFSNANDPGAAVIVTLYGTYSFQWTETNGTCSASDQVTVNFFAPPLSDAGPDDTLCGATYELAAVPGSGTGTWSQFAGPGTSSFSNINNPFATVTVSLMGTYVFVWSVNNNGCLSSDSITVVFISPPSPDAGNNGNECNLDHTFAAIPSVGTGTWSLVFGPGAAAFNNANDPADTVTVSTYGTYIFRWTEGNGFCTGSDDVTVNFFMLPNSDAGISDTSCGLTYALTAFPSFGIGQWSQVSGTGTAIFSNPNSFNSMVSVDSFGTYLFQWEETNVACSDSDTVQIDFFSPPLPGAGADASTCGNTYTLTGTSGGGTVVWSQLFGPGVTIFSNPANDTSDVSVNQYGTYIYRLSETNAGCTSYSDISVSCYEQPVANAGQSSSVCDSAGNLFAISSVGIGTWSKQSGPGIVSYGNSFSPATLVTVSQYGTYVFLWNEINGTCFSQDTATISFFQQPVVNAGADASICGNSYVLSGTSTGGAVSWSQVFGPAATFLTTPSNLSCPVSVNVFGSYLYRLTETNAGCSSYSDVAVTFYAQPVAYAGESSSVCDSVGTLIATASVGSGAWSKQSGPGNATFSGSSNPSVTVAVSQYGTYLFMWTEINGLCFNSDTVTMKFFQQPVANAGTGGKQCDLQFVTNAVPSSGIGMWSMVIGTGTTLYVNPNDYATLLTVTNTGTYIFQWEEVNGICSSSDEIIVNFYPKPVASAGNDTSISLGDLAFLNGQGGDYYLWSPDSNLTGKDFSNPTAYPKQDQTYSMIVTTLFGCSDTDDVKITVLKDFTLRPTSVVTPNADGFNDTWFIDNVEFYGNCEVTIFNRYGNIVYQKKGYGNDFDGRFHKKPLPHGTYYYIIECSDSDKTWTGPITIVK